MIQVFTSNIKLHFIDEWGDSLHNRAAVRVTGSIMRMRDVSCSICPPNFSAIEVRIGAEALSSSETQGQSVGRATNVCNHGRKSRHA